MKQEINFEELANKYAEQILQAEDFQGKATPLKSAEQLKLEVHQQLAEFLKFKKQRAQIELAEKLIRENLKSLTSKIEYDSVIEQLDRASNHFITGIENNVQEDP